VKTHQIDLREKDVKAGPWKQENIDAEANLLIAGEWFFHVAIVVSEPDSNFVSVGKC